MENRKILVEVTPEEYQMIVDNKLDGITTCSNDTLIKEILRRCLGSKQFKREVSFDFVNHKENVIFDGELDGDTNFLRFKIKEK